MYHSFLCEENARIQGGPKLTAYFIKLDTYKIPVMLSNFKLCSAQNFCFSCMGCPQLFNCIYLNMLQRFLEPQLVDGGVVANVLFRHDGAPCHYALISEITGSTTFQIDGLDGGELELGLPIFMT